jgi:hypothetical protein
MIQDLLDYVWVSDVGNNPHGAAAYWAQGNINVKNSLESLSPGRRTCGVTHFFKLTVV